MRKINPDKIFEHAVQDGIDSYVFYFDSIESYFSRREPSLKRKTHFYLTLTLLAVFTFKYGLLSLYPDKLQLTPLKDLTLMFGKQAILFHALFFCFGLLTVMAQLIMVYYENRSNLKIYDIIVDWKARKPSYKISQRHLKKLKLRIFILYYGYIRIGGFFVKLWGTLFFISLTLVTYFYCDYGYTFILLLWTVLAIKMLDQMTIVILTGTFFFYVPITLINYRFDELIKKLCIVIKLNNNYFIEQILESYDESIGVVKQLSGPYNMIIGLVYCLVPYLLAIELEVAKIESDELLVNIFKLVYFLLFIGGNINAFIINQISASITVRNKSIPRYLYPIFCSQSKIRIRTKLKIESFIDRLNTQFIGFYCFNLFKFTKMAFYQYAITISTSYFLITSILQ